MQLNYKKYGEAGRNIVILHGLLGSSDNWMAIAKNLEKEYTVYLLDLRNHGQSPWSEEWNYEIMSEDLRKFIIDQNLDDIILVGHSMGGKVAMFYAGKYGNDSTISKLVVVDIAPKAYPIHHAHILEGLLGLDLSQIKSRRDADQHLATVFPNIGVRQFLLKNLQRGDDKKFYWQANLEVINHNLAIVGQVFPSDYKFEKATFFIRGEKSDYIKDNDQANIQAHFPHSELTTINNAGHWVHAEKSKEFLESLRSFIAS